VVQNKTTRKDMTSLRGCPPSRGVFGDEEKNSATKAWGASGGATNSNATGKVLYLTNKKGIMKKEGTMEPLWERKGVRG